MIVACAVALVKQSTLTIVICSAVNFNPTLTKKVLGSKYGLSSNEWINRELLEGWLIEHFKEKDVFTHPLFLLLDGHSTHYRPQAVRFAMKHDIKSV